MSLSLPAFAQGSNCPPGSWFCTEVEPAAEPTPAPPTRRAQPAQVDDDEPDAPPPPAREGRMPPPGYGQQGYGPPPPVVVYQPGPPPPAHVVIVSPGYRVAHMEAPPPPPPPPRWHPEWGINLRAEGMAFLRSDAAPTAGMGGVGGSLRFRPVPHLALEGGFDFLAGTDFNGFQRVETPFTMNGILYINPRNRVQLYGIGGFHFSHADVHSDSPSPLLQRSRDGYDASYTYFGGQGGGGIEVRASRRVAVDIDVLGFIRKRTDDGHEPEFVDPATNRTTNTSTGAVVRGGLTFWW